MAQIGITEQLAQHGFGLLGHLGGLDGRADLVELLVIQPPRSQKGFGIDAAAQLVAFRPLRVAGIVKPSRQLKQLLRFLGNTRQGTELPHVIDHLEGVPEIVVDVLRLHLLRDVGTYVCGGGQQQLVQTKRRTGIGAVGHERVRTLIRSP